MSGKNTTTSDATKTYIPPSPPKAPLSHGIVYHLLSLLLSSISFALVLIAYISSATPSPSTPGGLLASTPWLIHINQTMESNIQLDGGADTKTLRRWGLGTFGWCEWNFDSIDMRKKGECVKKFGWVLPGSAPKGDDILAVEMPAAIGGAMPILSHFLIISAVLLFIYTLLLILTLARPPPALQDRHHVYTLAAKPTSKQRKHIGYYHHLRGIKWGGLILAVGGLPVAIVALIIGIGVIQLNKGEQGLEAEYGSGGYMLSVASVMILLIELMVKYGGLRVKKLD